MQAHASQIPDDSFFLQLPPDAFRAVFGVEWFIHRGVPSSADETWLFEAAAGSSQIFIIFGGNMRRSRTFAVGLAVLIAAGAVSMVPRSEPAGAATKKPVAVYAKPGPYAAGVRTLTIGDRKVEVWYPAARSSVKGKTRDAYNIAKYLPQALQDLLKSKNVEAPFTTDAYRGVRPSTKGPFPLVLFAHGFSGWREQSTFLTTHLATWGFVVASPDFLERGLGAQLGVPVATAAHRGRHPQRDRRGDPQGVPEDGAQGQDRDRRPLGRRRLGDQVRRRAQRVDLHPDVGRAVRVRRRGTSGAAREALDVHHRSSGRRRRRSTA